MLKDRASTAEDPPPKCHNCKAIIDFDGDGMKKPCICKGKLKMLDRAVGSGRPKPHRSASNPPPVSSTNIAQRQTVAADEVPPAQIFRMAMNVYDDASVAYQASMSDSAYRTFMANQRRMPINTCEDAKVPTAPPSEQNIPQQPNPYGVSPEVKLEQMQPNPHGAAQEVKLQQMQPNPHGAAQEVKLQQMQPNPHGAAQEVKLQQMQPNPHGAAQEVKAQQTQPNPHGPAPEMNVQPMQPMQPNPYGAIQTANVQRFQPNPYAAAQIATAQRVQPQVLIDAHTAALQQMQLNAYVAAQMANVHQMQPNPYLAAHVPNLQQIQPNPSLAAQVPNIQQTQPNPSLAAQVPNVRHMQPNQSLAAQVNAYAAQAANMQHLSRPHIYDELGRTYGISPPGIDQRANHSPINRQMRVNPQPNYAYRMPDAHAYLTAAGNAQLPIDQPIIIQNLLPLLNLENQPTQGGFLAPLDYAMGAQMPNQGALPLHLIEAALSPTYIAKPAKRYTNPKKKYGNNTRGGYRGRGQMHNNYGNRNPQYHVRGGGPYVHQQHSYAPVAPNYGNNMPVHNSAQANNPRPRAGRKDLTKIVNYVFVEYDIDILNVIRIQARRKACYNDVSFYAKAISAMKWLMKKPTEEDYAQAWLAGKDAGSGDNDGLAQCKQLVTKPQKKQQDKWAEIKAAAEILFRKMSKDDQKFTIYEIDMKIYWNIFLHKNIEDHDYMIKIRFIRKPSSPYTYGEQYSLPIRLVIRVLGKLNDGSLITRRILIEIPWYEFKDPPGLYIRTYRETNEYSERHYRSEKTKVEFYISCVENAVERLRALFLKEAYAPRRRRPHPFDRNNGDSPRHDDVF